MASEKKNSNYHRDMASTRHKVLILPLDGVIECFSSLHGLPMAREMYPIQWPLHDGDIARLSSGCRRWMAKACTQYSSLSEMTHATSINNIVIQAIERVERYRNRDNILEGESIPGHCSVLLCL